MWEGLRNFPYLRADGLKAWPLICLIFPIFLPDEAVIICLISLSRLVQRHPWPPIKYLPQLPPFRVDWEGLNSIIGWVISRLT